MMTTDPITGSLLPAVLPDEAEIERRKAFLQFGSDEVRRLRELHLILEDRVDEFAAAFYDHLLSFDETRRLIPDERALIRLKAAQADYFRSLTQGDYGPAYFAHRVRVGRAHERVGLAPQWYLGAYAKYLGELVPILHAELGTDPEALVASLRAIIRVVTLDMGLAIDAYIEARDATIRGLRRNADLILDSMQDAILVLRSDLKVEFCNRPALDLLQTGGVQPAGSHFSALVDAAELESAAAAALAGQEMVQDRPFSLRVTGSGARRQVRATLKALQLPEDGARLLMVLHEISMEERFRRAAEEKLARSEALLRHAQSVARIGSWRVSPVSDAEGAIEWSEETYRIFGMPVGTPVTYTGFLALVHPDDRVAVDTAWQDALGGAPYRVEHRIMVSGRIRWVEERAEFARGPDGRLVSVLGTVQDITDRKKADGRIEQLAFYDALTELPNRTLFLDRLKRKLASARVAGHSLALLFIDLDRFKEINDTMGHLAGDRVLAEVAQRFRRILRQDELLARLGGDEFVVISEQTDKAGATKIAGRLQRSLVEPITLKGSNFTLGASIGIALYPQDGGDFQQLLKNADIAMYRAKGSGGGHCFFSAEMGARIARSLELARRFGIALQEGRLQLYFQPKVELYSGRLTGAEGLLRWHDPEWGWVSPAEFIPVIEERGMMVTVGEWVLTQACRQLRTWDDAGVPLAGRLAINVAAQQIDQESFALRVLEIVENEGVSPTRLEIEITESSMMRDPDCAMQATQRLVAEGFTFAIDDFGTGYSSLSYLKRFPAHTLKIDRSFVSDMLTDRNDEGIVKTVIGMAQSLGLSPLAEGVEDAAQAERLLALGCFEAQGFHFGRPVPAEQFERRWLQPAAVEYAEATSA